MTISPFSPINDRGQIVRPELRRQSRQQAADARRATAGGMLLSQTRGGPVVLPRPPDKIWARINGGSNPYGFVQQQVYLADNGTLSLSDHAGGMSSDGTATQPPAFEINGNQTVLDGTIVRLRLQPSLDHWLFDYCCGLGGGPPPDDFPELSGSGVGGDEPRDYYLAPCCPNLLLPPTLTFTFLSMGGVCSGLCEVGKSYPMFWNSLPFLSPNGQYFVRITDETEPGDPPIYVDPFNCVGYREYWFLWLVCNNNQLEVGVVFNGAFAGLFNFAGNTAFSPPVCDSPLELTGTVSDPTSFCNPIEFSITE